MAANFPTTLPGLVTTSSASATLAAAGHTALHNNAAFEINAIAAKVGVDGSAVTTTHDYKLSGVTSSDKAASLAGTEALTNKTLTGSTNSIRAGGANTSLYDSLGNREDIEKRQNEGAYNYVSSGGVWTGDSYASTRAGSMTAMIAYVSGIRVTVAAITAHTFTASKDTYVDVNTAGTVTYTEVSNNAASPALSAGNIRIAIVVTGASSIAAAGSINQGQPTALLPIASSIAYAVTDSLGNLIFCCTPYPKMIGYRQILSSFTTTTTPGYADVTGLSVPVIVPAGRKVKVSSFCSRLTASSAGVTSHTLREGSTGLQQSINSVGDARAAYVEVPLSPSAGLHTYVVSVSQNAAGTITFGAGTVANTTDNGPAWIKVELD